jgi:hypothetical protein
VDPVNWPKGFIYASTSISLDIHPSILQHLFTSPNPEDREKISPCIEQLSVHPAIQIKQLSSPHPLAGKDVFEGHPQHGVFALDLICKGEEIGEYVGEIQMGHTSDSGHGGVYCWRILVNELILNIYSRRIANELSFINDFRGLAEAPNVQTRLIAHRGLYYFGYEAICDILPSEELLIDYGSSWGKKISSN